MDKAFKDYNFDYLSDKMVKQMKNAIIGMENMTKIFNTIISTVENKGGENK